MAQQMQVSRTDQLKPFLMSAQRQITSLLDGNSERAKKFMAAALVVASDKALKDCQPDSIIQALVGVAMLDLSIDKNLGHAYLVPYGHGDNKIAQLQVGYKGFTQLLFRAGWLIKTFPVYKCDQFNISFNGWDSQVSFIPDIDSREEGDNEWTCENLRGVYVVARNADTKDEYSTFVSKKVIEKLRLNSSNQKLGKFPKAGEKERLSEGLPIGIWQQWYCEMAMGKAVKKLAKTLPIGDTRAQNAIVIDDKSDMGKPVNFKESAQEGFVVDMEVAGTDITGTDLHDILTLIEASQNITDLEKTSPLISKLSGAQQRAAKNDWIKKLKSFTEKSEQNGEIDLPKKIKECVDSETLTDLLKGIPEALQIEFNELIGDAYDSFRPAR